MEEIRTCDRDKLLNILLYKWMYLWFTYWS